MSPDPRPLFRAYRRAVIRHRPAEVRVERNLEASYTWICTAQDSSPDGGVSGSYNLVTGWSTSYPETTGYIIPTLVTYADVMSQTQAKERGLRMADWEIEVQLPTGAVRSGVLGPRIGPAVFNTGQVLFGWVRAYQVTGEERYVRAAQRAAEWLAAGQDADGAWRKDLSLLTTSTVQTYNARTAWGMALAGRVFDEPRWVRAARSNCEWALAQQQDNGWFKHNAFADDEVPLLHTIGYALEGMLGVGELLSDERYIHAATFGIKPLVEIYRRSGRLLGRYDAAWRATVSWRCLTGEAQIALVLLRLAKYAVTDSSFARTAGAILQDLGRIQDADSPYRQTRGGVSGSDPLWGRYCPLSYISWGTKFYLDALLLHLCAADVESCERPMLARRYAR